MDNLTGIKELYDVNLRLNKPLEIGGRKYDINESVLSFSMAELASLTQQKHSTSARGGYLNPAWVNWDEDHELKFGITHGVLSQKSWSLLANSQLKNAKSCSVSYSEELHTIEDNEYTYIDLKYVPNNCEQMGVQPNPNFEPLPMGRREELMLKPLPPTKTRWIFCYDAETGERIREFQIFYNRVFFKKDYKKISVDYTFDYMEDITVINVGERLFNGFMRLDGKVSIKDQKTGEVATGILELPKIKLASDFSLRLGKSYDVSVVSDFFFVAYPEEDKRRGQQSVAHFTFLDRELTGDYL